MARSARAAIEDLLTCERCHAFYYVERAEGGARTRMRCTSCGHTRDVWLTEAQAGGYTVIDPDGKVTSFPTWDELVAAKMAVATSAVTRVDHRTLPEKGDQEESSPPSPLTTEAARPEPVVVEEPKKVSAAALLDVTPNPPKLALVETPVDSPSSPGIDITFPDSSPALPTTPDDDEEIEAKRRAAEAETQDETRVEEKKPEPEAKVDAKVEPEVEKSEAKDEAKIDAKAEPDGPRQITPLVIDDTSAPEKAIEQLGEHDMSDEVEEIDQSGDDAEALSLRDVVVVPAFSEDDVPENERHVSSTPPPPVRGALRTLPPSPRMDAPPPPTITVDDEDGIAAPTAAEIEKDRQAREKAEKKKDEGKVAAKTEKTEKKDDAPAKAKPTEEAKVEKVEKVEKKESKAVPPSTRPLAKAQAQASAAPKRVEEAKRGWLLPAIGVVAAAAIVWRLMSSTTPQTPTPDPAAVKPTTTPTATTAQTADPANTATNTAADPNTALTNDPPPPESKATNAANKPPDIVPPTGTGTAVVKPGTKPAEGKKPEGNLSMSEALDKAGAARRGADYAKARELYERVLRENPANVEANGGLGDVARAQGDLNGAKNHYQKALGVSPSYGPAQIGLADTEWDLGNKAAAQKHYAAIVTRLGANAPERVRQRSGTEGN